MRHFLVTGGAGFVGSHLVDALVALGHGVTVLDNLSTGLRENIHANATLVEGDVCDHSLITRLITEADFCFHLAAIASVQQCNESWAKSHAVNQAAFVGLLEASAKRKNHPVPVIYASSAAVYGDTEILPISEDAPLRPISVYGADKAGCEMHAHVAGRQAGVPSFGLRPFNIYGSRQHAGSPYSGVITVFIDRLLRGEGLTIYGDGKQTRDFISVADIIRHFIAAIDKVSLEAPVVNAATGKQTSILDIAHLLAKILGREAKISFAATRTGDIYRSGACTKRARSMLGIEKTLDIAEGLEFVVNK